MKKNNARAVEMGLGLVLGGVGSFIMTIKYPLILNFQNISVFVGGTGLVIIGLLLFMSEEEFEEYKRFFKKLKNIWDSFRVIK